MENIREAASAVYKSSEHKGDDAFRQQAVSLLEQANAGGQIGEVTNMLEQTGTLPQLVISEFGRLDKDGNGSVSQGELQGIMNDTESDALTKMAAKYANEQYWGINDADDQFLGAYFDNDQIEMGEINAWRDKARASRVAEPSEMYKADRVINAQTPQDELNELLTRGASSPQQQLKAIESLLAKGQSSFEMTDLDGNKYNVSINVHDYGGGVKAISLQANDDGNTYPLLKAVSRNGVFEQQQGKNGLEDWYGSKWQKLHPNSAFAS
jgi:hypothetical protein